MAGREEMACSGKEPCIGFTSTFSSSSTSTSTFTSTSTSTSAARVSGEIKAAMGATARAKAQAPLRVLNLPREDITQRYSLGAQLGEGMAGVVRLCTDRRTGEVLACKSIPKDGGCSPEELRREVCALGMVNTHPAVARLRNVVEDDKDVHLVMELCRGGDLFDRVAAEGRYAEADAAVVCRVLASALSHCHALGIAHRDLKPENVLLLHAGSRTAVKLADFGHCAFFTPGEKLTECVGTPYYVAPEVLEGEYGPEADIWSLGVILHILLCGEPPFAGDAMEDILRAVEAAELDLAGEAWQTLSPGAADLVAKMLTRDVTRRITLAQIKVHPWIVEHCGMGRPRSGRGRRQKERGGKPADGAAQSQAAAAPSPTA